MAAGCAGSPDHSSAQGTKSGALSASDLQGRWWSWASSTDEASNPVADTTGDFCAANQPQDVWFLAGTFGGKVNRSCHVPASRRLAFPLMNMVGSAGQCLSFPGDAAGEATLDGTPLKADYYAATAVTVTAVDGNPLGVAAGTHHLYACGFWAQIPALSSGPHHLVIKGSSGSFSVEADYSLSVG